MRKPYSVVIPDRRTRRELLNDLDASRLRESHAASENAMLHQRVTSAEHALHQALVDRDDWRSAFKLIMRLVK